MRSSESSYAPALIIGRGKGALAVVRSLGARDVPVWVASERHSPPGASRFSAGRLRTPDMGHDPEGFRDYISHWAESCATRPVLFPTDDVSVEWIAKYRSVLAALFLCIGPSPAVVGCILDKARQYRVLRETGLFLPRFWVAGEDGVRETLAAEAIFPLILKPRFSQRFFLRNGFKALYLNDLAELDRALATYNEPVLIQERVDGDIEQGFEYTSFVSSDGVVREELVLRKRDVHPKPFGNTTVVETWREPAVCALGRQALKALGYTGISQTEFKQVPQSGEFQFIEINPRVVNNTGIERMAGINTAWAAYAESIGVACNYGQQHSARIVWHCPELRIPFDRRLRLPSALPASAPGPVRSVTDLFIWHDPLPLLQKLGNACVDRIPKRGLDQYSVADTGWRDIWTEMIDRTVHKVYRRGRMIIVDDSNVSASIASGPGITIREVREPEIQILEKIVKRRAMNRFRHYFSTGATCLGAWKDGELVGYTWTTDTVFQGIHSVPIELPPGSAYGWELFVAPAARAQGIASLLLHARRNFEACRGNSRFLRMVRLDNPAAMRTVEKTISLGGVIIGEIQYRKVFRRFFVRRIAPEHESEQVYRLRERYPHQG